jgi:hypothetical protein
MIAEGFSSQQGRESPSDVVELSDAEVLLDEKSVVENGGEEVEVQELSPADMIVPEALPAGAEVLELGQTDIVSDGISHADAEQGASGEELLEEPLDAVYRGLDFVSAALADFDVQGIRQGSRQLAAIADSYGMHTLADMARCFRAAWEEGDIEAAGQIIEEMRSEAARQL